MGTTTIPFLTAFKVDLHQSVNAKEPHSGAWQNDVSLLRGTSVPLGGKHHRIVLSPGGESTGVFFVSLQKHFPCVRRTTRSLTFVRKKSSADMKSRKNPHSVQFAYDISAESKARFEKIHNDLKFKTKSQTLEAIIYQVSLNEIVGPDAIFRIENKLDRVLEYLEGN